MKRPLHSALNTIARRRSAKLERILKLTVKSSQKRKTCTWPQVRLALQILANKANISAILTQTRRCKLLACTLHACSHTPSLCLSQREQSAKRVKTTNSDVHRSNIAPLQKSNHNPTTTLPAGEDDRFNLRYGGIMDEDIQETVPHPVKQSQVKVCSLSNCGEHRFEFCHEQVITRVEHNTPLVKVEALDPGLPGSRRGKAKDRSSQACLDLNSQQLGTWKKVLVPAFRSVLGALSNPWDHSNPEILNELIYIYQLVLPDAPRNIEHNGPEYLIVSCHLLNDFAGPWLTRRNKACQRGREWRARIAREVLQATKVYLIDTCGESPTAIAEYVQHLMDGACYMWEEHESNVSNHIDYQGNL